jgi:hypothetical protein
VNHSDTRLFLLSAAPLTTTTIILALTGRGGRGGCGGRESGPRYAAAAEAALSPPLARSRPTATDALPPRLPLLLPQVLAVKADLAKVQLTQPVCTQEGEKIALSRRVEKHWR